MPHMHAQRVSKRSRLLWNTTITAATAVTVLALPPTALMTLLATMPEVGSMLTAERHRLMQRAYVRPSSLSPNVLQTLSVFQDGCDASHHFTTCVQAELDVSAAKAARQAELESLSGRIHCRSGE